MTAPSQHRIASYLRMQSRTPKGPHNLVLLTSWSLSLPPSQPASTPPLASWLPSFLHRGPFLLAFWLPSCTPETSSKLPHLFLLPPGHSSLSYPHSHDLMSCSSKELLRRAPLVSLTVYPNNLCSLILLRSSLSLPVYEMT